MEFPYPLPLLLDGATGTNLYAAGMPAGVCVEAWILEHPDAILDLQRAFIDAGSDVIYAPTFSANREKLSHYGYADRVDEFNKRLVELSKRAAAGRALIAGDMSPSGLFIEPFGDTSFTELIDLYKEQAYALRDAGVDYIAVETMMSLADMRAAVIAARKANLPAFVSVTVDEQGRTLTGASALSCLVVLQSMGVRAFGLNCSFGPDLMAPVLREIAPFAEIPLIAKPNAGMPNPEVPGEHELSPEQMAQEFTPLLDAGARIIGGCCGSTPAHIAALHELRRGYDFAAAQSAIQKESAALVFASEAQTFHLSPENVEISEPLECSVDMTDELLELGGSSYDVICVRVNTPDDAYQFSLNAHMASLPVMFSSHNEIALKTALLLYQGRALVDKECDIAPDKLHKIAVKYGAVVY